MRHIRVGKLDGIEKGSGVFYLKKYKNKNEGNRRTLT